MRLKIIIHKMLISFLALASIVTFAAEKKEYKHISASLLVYPAEHIADLAKMSGQLKKKFGVTKDVTHSAAIPASVRSPKFHMTLASFAVDSTDMDAAAKRNITNAMEKILKEMAEKYLTSPCALSFKEYEIFNGAQRTTNPPKQFIGANFDDHDKCLIPVVAQLRSEFVERFQKVCDKCTLWTQSRFVPHVSIVSVAWNPSGRKRIFTVPFDGRQVEVDTPADYFPGLPKAKEGTLRGIKWNPSVSNFVVDSYADASPHYKINVGEIDGWFIGRSVAPPAKRQAIPAACPAAVKKVEAPIEFNSEDGPRSPYYGLSAAYDGAPGADPMIPGGIAGYNAKVGLGLGKTLRTADELYQQRKKVLLDLKKRGSSQTAVSMSEEQIADTAMLGALQNKFGIMGERVIPELQKLLLDTGDREIINRSRHPVWGKTRDGQGRNMLGILLMQVRDELRKAQSQ